jgi:hypothetical protein
MKRILFSAGFHLLIFIIVLSLNDCEYDKSNLLRFKNQKNWSETNTFRCVDSTMRLYQIVCYDQSHTNDACSCYTLLLDLPVPKTAKAKAFLNLGTDTALVRSQYIGSGAFTADLEKNKVTGQIKITEWDADKIIIAANVEVFDEMRGDYKILFGTRVFTRQN